MRDDTCVWVWVCGDRAKEREKGSSYHDQNTIWTQQSNQVANNNSINNYLKSLKQKSRSLPLAPVTKAGKKTVNMIITQQCVYFIEFKRNTWDRNFTQPDRFDVSVCVCAGVVRYLISDLNLTYWTWPLGIEKQDGIVIIVLYEMHNLWPFNLNCMKKKHFEIDLEITISSMKLTDQSNGWALRMQLWCPVASVVDD